MTTRHLTEDQIVIAAIDPLDLSSAEKRHLDSCPECQKACARLKGELGDLGSTAKKMLPSAPPCVIPEKSSRRRFWLAWSTAGSLTAFALVLAFIWAGPAYRTQRPLELLPDSAFGGQQTVFFLELEDQREVFTPFEEFVLGEDEVALDERWWEFVAPFGAEEESLT